MLARNRHALFLFAINKLFRIAILNQLFSLLNESAYVIELLGVVEVGQDLIPWSTLNSFLWKLSVVKDFNCIRIIWLESKVMLHIVVLKDKLIGLRQLDGFEEMWQVFINIDLVISELETPLLKLMS